MTPGPFLEDVVDFHDAVWGEPVSWWGEEVYASDSCFVLVSSLSMGYGNICMDAAGAYHLGTCRLHRCILSVGVLGSGKLCSYMAQLPRPVPISRICLHLVSRGFHGSLVSGCVCIPWGLSVVPGRVGCRYRRLEVYTGGDWLG